MSTIFPADVSADDIARAVRARYSEVSEHPDRDYNFRVGRDFAIALGYPEDILDALPSTVWEAFTGVATPSLLAEVRLGETVVDLGCGAGLDLILLSQKVGAAGHAIGIDFSAAMIERARRSIALLNLSQTEARIASADDTGIPACSVDLVVANGILNLTPDKVAVVREIARILRPGGRFLVAETTLRGPLPPGEVSTMDDWFR